MKDWVGNGNSIYKTLGASNHCDDEREANDYYATDPKAVDELLKVEEFDHNIWECACGEGHISNRLKELGYNVYSTDVVERGYEDEVLDFLTCERKFNGDIITNPPYKYSTEFILKAMDTIKEGRKVAMFLKLQALEGYKRYMDIYSKYPPKKVYVCVKRINCGKNGKFEGTSAVCYAWFIWEKGFIGATELEWINKGE
jgi:hypothetical protein